MEYHKEYFWDLDCLIIFKTLFSREHGFESINCGIARDEPSSLVTALSNALKQADILVCTGGVSMGERDLLKPVLVKVRDKINMQPLGNVIKE